ncbi:hypothetical protein NIES2107_50730 [Nostoc carneum NIES-2107]|nr:hypothetical protein NIES2107_50730 [Nostoc carneum NIES-2107]
MLIRGYAEILGSGTMISVLITLRFLIGDAKRKSLAFSVVKPLD